MQEEEKTTKMQLQDTIDNGESVVQIAEIGKVVGSDIDGNPVEQELDEESLKNLADKLNASGREVLVDRDHASSKPGLDRDTSAQGWASEFEVREGQGLFGKIRWSDIGKKLVENRVFRWLSPVFKIGSDKKPVDMQAIALTNTPSQMLLKPVLNQAADEQKIEQKIEDNNQEEISESKDMNIEDIKKIVFDVLKEAGLAVDGKAVDDKAVNGKAVDDAVVEEVKREIAEDKLDKLEDEAEMKAAEALVESMTEEKAKEEVKNAACGKVKDEVKNEVCDEAKDEVKEEVIKAEVLNQKPTIGLAARGDADKWRSMNHTEFMKYIESGAYKKDL